MDKVYKYTKGENKVSYVPTIEHGMDSLKYAMGFDGPEAGYFLTESELKRVAQEAWDSGVDAYRQYSEYGVRLTFDEYWAEQQARKGEG